MENIIKIDLNNHKNSLTKRSFYILQKWLEGKSIQKLSEEFEITKSRITQIKLKSLRLLSYILMKDHSDIYFKCFENGNISHYLPNSVKAKNLLKVVKSIEWIDRNENNDTKNEIDSSVKKFIEDIKYQNELQISEIIKRQKIINNVIDKFISDTVCKDIK